MPRTLSQPKSLNQFTESLPPYLKGLWRRSGVLDILISCLPDPPASVIRHWDLTIEEVERLRLRGCPSRLKNIMAANEVASRCDYSLLTSTLGFFSYTIDKALCDYHDDCECFNRPTWMIDIHPDLAGHGIVVPIVEPRYRWTTDLVIFRNSRDQKPFPLRVRQREAIAA